MIIATTKLVIMSKAMTLIMTMSKAMIIAKIMARIMTKTMKITKPKKKTYNTFHQMMMKKKIINVTH